MSEKKVKNCLGIIGAMDGEVENLKESAHITETLKRADMEFNKGTLNDTDVVIVKCGVGKVNASICCQILIDLFNVTHIINTGLAGSLTPDARIGDIVLSTDALQHDFDVTPIGFAKAEIPFTGLSSFKASEELRRIALEATSSLHDIHVIEGRICSGDKFISNASEKNEIIKNFGGACCEMEGASVAQTCYLNHIPFLVVRAISDSADDSASKDFNFSMFEKSAAQRGAAIVKYIASKL